jgi:polar amino acid transport system substrate-binding protein
MNAKIILLMTALIFVPSAWAQSIRVVTENTAYSYLKDDKIAGSATAVVELALKEAGLTDYQLNLYPWARSYDMALKDPNVLIYLIARTPERELRFKWAGEIMKIRYHLYKLKSRAISVTHLEDAKAFAIGVIRDDVRYNYLKKAGFTRLVVAAQQEENFRRLLSGQVDLLPMPDDDVAFLCKETLVSCDNLEKIYTLDDLSIGLYMAYSNATPHDIVLRTKSAFEKLRASGLVQLTMEKK